MRKIFDLFLLFLLFLFLFWQKDNIVHNVRFLASSPCDIPITYRLGEVDSGYGLTNQQFLTKVKDAGQIWDSVVGKTLFKDDTNGKLTINLIYSERQSMADNLNKLEQNLKNNKESISSMRDDYEKSAADFEKRLADFNQQVAYWNQQGHISQDTYNSLMSEQASLKAEADRLNNLARQLNLSVKEYNSQVGQFNQDLGSFKEAIVAKPEAGLFDGSVPKIDIYLTNSNQELIHTLTHEMGHALTLPHINDPKSIMYPLTSEITQPSIEEAVDLKTYCGQKNFEISLLRLKERLQANFQK